MKKTGPLVVLVCPLNWGLGHATRCIPVVRSFLNRGCQVVIGSEGSPMALLQEAFGDQVSYKLFPGKKVRYPADGRMVTSILFQLPSLLFSVFKEHFRLRQLIRETGASIVVSDNRYGLSNPGVQTIFLTHQVFIRATTGLRWAERMLDAFVRVFILRFDVCWVPDYPGPKNLSGSLSHKRVMPGLRFVGPLSRFAAAGPKVNPLPEGFSDRFYLLLLSGPEPQRSMLESLLLSAEYDHPVVMVRGKAGEKHMVTNEHRVLIDHAGTASMRYLISKALLVICRPGYSTIMDLSSFGKKALMIPTPGQTEQEYLGALLSEREWVAAVPQDQLCSALSAGISLALQKQGIPCLGGDRSLLSGAVDEAMARA